MVWTMALAMGVCGGLWASDWPLWLGLTAAMGVGLGFVARRRVGLAWLAALLTAGGCVGAWASCDLRQHIANVEALRPGQPLCIAGKVAEGVVRTPTGMRFSVVGNAEAGGPRGRFRVLLRGHGHAEIQSGDGVLICGQWQPPFGFFNPGARDPWAGGAIRRDCGGLRADKMQRLQSGFGPRRWAEQARRALSQSLATLPPARAAFLRATVLGERAAVEPEVELGFKAAGATHALSVSGLHLAAVAVLFFVGLRKAVLLSPWLALRVAPQVLAAAFSIPAVVFYTLMTGEAVATWRSALMASMVFAAYALRRSPAIGTSISVAVLGIGAHSVFWLGDISFQLSVGSVVALAVFAGPLGPGAMHTKGLRARAFAWLWRGMAATLAAGLLTAPLVAYHFGEVTPAAPAGNLVLTPLVEMLVVPLGLAGATLGAVHPWLGMVPLFLCDQAARFTLFVARTFATYAPVWYVAYPSLAETLVLSFAFVLFLWGLAMSARSVARQRVWLLGGLALALAACLFWGRGWSRTHSEEVRVTFLDVGQGDAAVVEGPRGLVAVIDAGGLGEGFDTGARIVGPYLQRRGIHRIDVLALSHPHPDHAQGMPHLLERFEVGVLWMPVHADGPSHDGAITKDLRRRALARGTTVPAPQPLHHHGLTLVPLGPWAGERIAAPEGLSVNDASLSLRLAYAGHSVLFAGDLEAPGELELAELAEQGLVASADVLKAPHHGSRTSSSEALLGAVQPRVVVVSAGRGNRFGFPHPEVLSRYDQHHLRVLRTDRDGAVELRWGPGTPIEAACVRGCGVDITKP